MFISDYKSLHKNNCWFISVRLIGRMTGSCITALICVILFNCHSYHFSISYHSPDSGSRSPASQKQLYSHMQTEKQTSAPQELKAEVKKWRASTGKTYSVIHFCLLHHTQTAHDRTERDERVFLCSQTAFSLNNKSYCFSTTIRWCDSTDTSIEFRPNKRQDMTVKVYISWHYQF